MKTKITFAVLAIATLVAAPALAQQAPQRPQSPPPAAINQTSVIVDGKLIGADPDPRIRMELLREHYLDSTGW